MNGAEQLALFIANGQRAQEAADRAIAAYARPAEPPPPTGPAADPHTPESGTYRAYEAWLLTEEGAAAFAWVEAKALEQVAAGATRVSPRTLVARARDALRARINDHFTPWIADDLVAKRPELLDVVERRKRKKAKA